MCRSEPQIPLASTRTIASSGASNSGSATSSTRTSPGAWKVTARMPRAYERIKHESGCSYLMKRVAPGGAPSHDRSTLSSGEEKAMGIEKSRPVLITGCSTGIGRATAERLADDGWNVHATARRLETIEDLAKRGCKIHALDVTDEASMESAVASIAEDGPIGALINNAGYSQSGAIETIPMESV